MSLGLGVMINRLGGNEKSAETFGAALGKRITALRLDPDDNALHFEFDDGSKIRLLDNGQSCCEVRYMTTDDDLSYFIGAVLTGGEVKEGPPVSEECGDVHEVAFLEIQTDRGVFTMSNHNEHNGYYGGFWVIARREE